MPSVDTRTRNALPGELSIIRTATQWKEDAHACNCRCSSMYIHPINHHNKPVVAGMVINTDNSGVSSYRVGIRWLPLKHPNPTECGALNWGPVLKVVNLCLDKVALLPIRQEAMKGPSSHLVDVTYHCRSFYLIPPGGLICNVRHRIATRLTSIISSQAAAQ